MPILRCGGPRSAIMKIVFIVMCSVLSLSASALSQEKRFTLLHTSDEHATLLPMPLVDYQPGQNNPALGGYARLATLLRQIRDEKTGEPVMLFSSGDIIGGTPYAWLALEGLSPEIELMQQMGYHGMAIGNHEFDYGPERLADYFLRAGYPAQNDRLTLLGANLVIPDNHPLHAVGIAPRQMYTLSNGMTLGVFGLLGKAAYRVAPSAKPVAIADPHESAAEQVKALRDAGADIIIALTHAGIREDRDLAANVTGIDIVLGGHDHIVTDPPEVIGRTIILHSGHYLRYLGVLELVWNSQTGRLDLLNETRGRPYLIPLNSDVAEDPGILARIDDDTRSLTRFVSSHTEGLFDDMRAHLMQTAFPLIVDRPLAETTVGNFVADAMRLSVEDALGERVDVAIQANGVIRANIKPGTMPWSDSKVSFFDLASVSGLGTGPDGKAGYPLVSLYLTPREIHNILEISSLLSQLMGNQYFLQVSGLRYRYDPGKALWLRIPFLNIPVPAYRSVRGVQLFTGRGLQDGSTHFEPLDPDGEGLLHVVTDYYLTSFLPMIGDVLPRLKLVLKDRHGNPVGPEETIIQHNQREFKVWEAVARYAVALDQNDQGVPVIPDSYRTIQGRIVREQGLPLAVWAYIAVAAVAVALLAAVFWILRWRVRKNRPETAMRP